MFTYFSSFSGAIWVFFRSCDLWHFMYQRNLNNIYSELWFSSEKIHELLPLTPGCSFIYPIKPFTLLLLEKGRPGASGSACILWTERSQVRAVASAHCTMCGKDLLITSTRPRTVREPTALGTLLLLEVLMVVWPCPVQGAGPSFGLGIRNWGPLICPTGFIKR